MPKFYPKGIKLLKKKGWKEIIENSNSIALKKKNSTISLEPRCQIELSGGKVKTIHQTCRQAKTYLDELKTICIKNSFFFFVFSINFNSIGSKVNATGLTNFFCLMSLRL